MRRVSGERGSVAIIVALSLTALLGMAALAIDVGTMLTAERELQNGADAAAIAIARQCAEHAVDPVANPTSCTVATADATAAGYLTGNATSTTPSVLPSNLSVSWAGKVGKITVRAQTTKPPIFAGMLGVTGPLNVTAKATARWGPLTAVDEVLPLIFCKGAIPDPGDVVTMIVDPAAPPAATRCDGAPTTPEFGWTTPDDTVNCRVKVSLLPTSYFDVQPASDEPAGCQLDIDELHNDVNATAVCHTTARETYHCHGSADTDDRMRYVAVYDPAAGVAGARPAYSIVALEITGARLGDEPDDYSYSAGGWIGPCEVVDPNTVGDIQCIEAIVHNYFPPVDGPIFDPTIAALAPSIDDTTVLDVRLVD